MASVCFYFQVHQPFRLRRYSVFDTDRHYFDDHKNAEIVRKVAPSDVTAAARAITEGRPVPQDRWGDAVTDLRARGFISQQEETTVTSVYTFASAGAHLPLGLTDEEENQIVAFLQAMTDGFTTPYPHINTFTGRCSTCNPATDSNCSPSRQGNGSLIPIPTPLPPCASAICGVPPLPRPKPIR